MSWMLLFFACENMPTPGKPFASVAMNPSIQRMGEAVEVPSGMTETDASVSDEFRDPQEVIDLTADAEAVEPSTLTTTETTSTSDGNVVTIDATNVPSETVITPNMLMGGMASGQTLPAYTVVTQELESADGGATVNPLNGNNGWPVRLVGTMAGAQPPRAVLGFASGEEVVVTPGMLLPAHQLVVMSIGASQVQLAKIIPMGDHAAIQSMSLQAQYPE
ncbi:MAG: hypothetical protein ACON4U_05615 [Myxococcota bacterium]